MEFDMGDIGKNFLHRNGIFTMPEVAIVAGSGFNGISDLIENAVVIPYAECPNYPHVKTVVGHGGELVLGKLNGVNVMVFNGRPHMYQGITAMQAAYPSRLAASMGCHTILITNAAGGVNPEYKAGDIMFLNGHINFLADNPLIGWDGGDRGNPFVPLNYSKALREALATEFEQEGLTVYTGVYAAFLGPSYETRSEVKMLQTMGVDAVGMSTVPEAIAAMAFDMRVVALSLVANGAGEETIDHNEVLAVGQRSMDKLCKALYKGIKYLAAE